MAEVNIDFSKTDVSQLTGVATPVILSTAEEILQTLATIPEYKEGKYSGYLTIRRKLAAEIVICCRLGIIPHQDDADPKFRTKARKYLWCSQEKPKRLIEMNFKYGHVLSWQSKDVTKNQYGGSVWCGEFAISFSGLPELADEALCLVLAAHFGWITIEQANEYASISQNLYFTSLWTAWTQR